MRDDAMEPLHILILSLIQGITEFLPISSSAHLILAPHLFGWEDQGIVIDIMLHVGSLFAVMLYFRQDMVRLVHGGLASLSGKSDGDARFFQLLVLATIPVVLAGLALKLLGLGDQLRDPLVIAIANLVFALPLWWFDVKAPTHRTEKDISFKDAAIIGLAQCLALIPGTSRSGITMTAARMLGFARDEAARFGMLLAVPTILAALLLAILDVSEQQGPVDYMALVIALVGSFFFALTAIAALMALVNKTGFLPYVLYRLGLGLFLLIFFL
jgi:undecaprenyl-diphosphatase